MDRLYQTFFNRKLKVVSVKHGFDEPYSARYGNDQKHLWKSLFFWLQILRLVSNLQCHCVKRTFAKHVCQWKNSFFKKIRNVYYGLDLKEKESLVVERNPAEKFAIILGRLVKYKGHENDKDMGKSSPT